MPVPIPEPQPVPGSQDLTAVAREVPVSAPSTPSLQPQPPAPVPPPQPSATSRPVPAASQVQHVEPHGIAQPVGGTWANRRSNAILEAQAIKTLKVQQHEMDEQQKRTCVLVVYHTVCVYLFYSLQFRLENLSLNLEWRATNTTCLLCPIFSPPTSFHFRPAHRRSRAPTDNKARFLERRMDYHLTGYRSDRRKRPMSSSQDPSKSSEDS